jgi:hypothetical protein
MVSFYFRVSYGQIGQVLNRVSFRIRLQNGNLEKLEAVQLWPPQRDKHELRSFLGLSSPPATGRS